MDSIKAFIYRFFSRLGVSVLSIDGLLRLHRLADLGVHKIAGLLRESAFASSFTEAHKDVILSNFRSQFGQDIFALSLLGPNSPGFFVEFGATNGIDLSNTYLLESHFGWRGILCEPASVWHRQLKKNRIAIIDSRCVFSESGLSLTFLETGSPELSTINGFGESDEHAKTRLANRSYQVETVSLMDLLKQHNAPTHIDFLSIDTEGSELEILSTFDFSQYTFGGICIEHNFTPNRPKIKRLLDSKGYLQVHPGISEYDDWFVPKTNQTIAG
jgi:FkbM family methyltransferase